MKKILKITLVSFIILIGFYFTTKAIAAVRPYQSLGGKITSTRSTKIEELEDQGYTCEVPGTTIEINPVRPGFCPMSYIIPYSTVSKTLTTPRSGQFILGLYSSITTQSTCTKIISYYPLTISTIEVMLPTIKMFGTSK